MNSKILYLFTAEYPYGSHETYMENEIHYLSERFDTIYLFPRNNSKKELRSVPSNVFIVNTYSLSHSTKKIFFPNFLLIFKVLFLEFVNVKNKMYFLKNIREWNSIFCQSISLSSVIIEHVQKNSKNNKLVFYSYWMNDWALALAVLKDKKLIEKFVFRVLGFDIYNERWKNGYMPFRYYIYSKVDRVFTVSKDAETYIKKLKIFPEKIFCSYFGTKDYGPSLHIPGKENFVMYSSSNIIRLKRLNLIVEILKHVNFNLKWIHRGEGSDKDILLDLVKSLPDNIQFELLPREENYNDVLNYLRVTPINLFVNVSESEGLPVTIIEAISFGIPVLATDVGGTAEVVTLSTGILIPKEFDPKEIASIINSFRGSVMNTLEYRNNIRKFWVENFDASKNYKKFCDLLDT